MVVELGSYLTVLKMYFTNVLPDHIKMCISYLYFNYKITLITHN